MDVAKAAQLVAFVHGYHVQASSKACAAITVYCKSAWTGTILVTLRNDVVCIVANIAKCPKVLPVVTTEATVSSFVDVLTFVAQTIHAHFYNLVAGQSPMAPPQWHTNERLLMHSAVTLANSPSPQSPT